MAIFNNNGNNGNNGNNDGAVAIEGLAQQPPVNQELFEKLSELADMLDTAFEMDGLTGVGDRAIIYFMTAITISLDSIRDIAEVELQLSEVAEEINSFGAVPPGGIDADWWNTFKATLAAARHSCLV